MSESIAYQPIYIVVFEHDHDLTARLGHRWTMFHLVKSIPCDVADIEAVWEREVAPLYATNRHIQVQFVIREPENPFKEMAEKPSGWLPGD